MVMLKKWKRKTVRCFWNLMIDAFIFFLTLLLKSLLNGKKQDSEKFGEKSQAFYRHSLLMVHSFTQQIFTKAYYSICWDTEINNRTRHMHLVPLVLTMTTTFHFQLAHYTLYTTLRNNGSTSKWSPLITPEDNIHLNSMGWRHITGLKHLPCMPPTPVWIPNTK